MIAQKIVPPKSVGWQTVLSTEKNKLLHPPPPSFAYQTCTENAPPCSKVVEHQPTFCDLLAPVTQLLDSAMH